MSRFTPFRAPRNRVRHRGAAQTLGADAATRDVLHLRVQARKMRAVLAGLRNDVCRASSSRRAALRATELLVANEQLVISALRAKNAAEANAQALEEVSRSAENQALHDLRMHDVLAHRNAGLESRVLARTAELVLARDEALDAVRAKERFLSNMSHEIRTPMAGMLGALELLSHTELSPVQVRYLEVASTSGTALLAILNEVLDFAKIGAGRLELTQEQIDLVVIVRSVATLFSAAAQSQSVDLRVSIDPSLSPLRRGDSLHLRQVLMNLVGNAIKFAPHGQVTLTVRPAVASATDDRVCFEVQDSGIGIDQAQQAMIFEPFSQSPDAGRPSSGGTGLGLAISRQLVRAMGGELHVDSAVGQGARFHFDLALAVAAPPTTDAPAPVPPAIERWDHCVLLVEDNPVNQIIGTAMLESFGLTVAAAGDGQAALDLLALTRFAVVLMDCQMPVMDGYEATRRWREVERVTGRTRTAVIALTANAFHSDVDHCLAAGMDAHLAKPFTGEQLRAVLAHWLSKSGR